MSSDLAYSVLSYFAYFIICFFSFRKNPFVFPSPSSFFLYYVVLLCFPGFFLFYKGNETPVFGVGNFVIFYDHVCYCLLAVYISAVFACFISEKLFKNRPYYLPCPHVSNYAFLVCLFFILCWIIFPKRLTFLEDLWRSFISGSSLESNYLRRIQYAEGFYETKVFTWLRYSIVPLCLSFVFFYSRTRLGLIFSLFIFCCLFLASAASFHKSSWLMPFVYSFLLYALFFTNSRIHKRFFWLIPFTLMPFILLLLYLIQYREYGLDLFEEHLAVSFERFYSAFTGSIIAFTSEFRFDSVNLENVFLPAGLAETSPEEIVGLSTGGFTTFQAGVMGAFYAALGFVGIILYFVFFSLVILLVDFLYFSLIQNGFSLCSFLLILPPIWILQASLYPALFSSGLFILILIAIPSLLSRKNN